VIGVTNYDWLDVVPNAVRDAEDTEIVLQRAGFSFVRLLRNPIEKHIHDAMKELVQRTAGADHPAVVVIFFAGHGFQSEGHTYIAPKDATREDPTDRSISISDLIAKVASPGRGGLAIFLVDACRTPVSASGQSSTAEGSDDGIPRPPGGAILGLATKAGAPARSAAHIGDESSPYTSALRQYIPSQLRLTAMFEHVRVLVEELTQDDQSPDVAYGANGDGFYFMPSDLQREAESFAWRTTLETNRPACIRRYMKTHPDSRFLRAALRWLSQPRTPDLPQGGVPCPDE
jgi:uncharacterized caspase-like protein